MIFLKYHSSASFRIKEHEAAEVFSFGRLWGWASRNCRLSATHRQRSTPYLYRFLVSDSNRPFENSLSLGLFGSKKRAEAAEDRSWSQKTCLLSSQRLVTWYLRTLLRHYYPDLRVFHQLLRPEDSETNRAKEPRSHNCPKPVAAARTSSTCCTD